MSTNTQTIQIPGTGEVEMTMFATRNLEHARQHATETGGVLYTQFDDETSYRRGAHYVNRYLYAVLPADFGETFETTRPGHRQAT